VSDAGRPAAVLDADIIYSRVLHDLIGRTASDLRVLSLFWSDELLAETREVLLENKGLSPASAQRWVDYLPRNFPAGKVEIAQVLASTDFSDLTSDPGDHHVCALVIASRAKYLFTHDRGYLHDGLQRYGVAVITPDQFLAPLLDADSQRMLAVLERQANAWAGGRTIEDLIDAIERAGAPTFAAKVRVALEA
jgi:predicted nucleic acid-binding protein